MIKKKLSKIFISLLCLTLLFGLCSTASASTPLDSSSDVEIARAHKYMVTASVLNVRSGPGTNYPIVGQLYYGNIVEGYAGDRTYANGYWWIEVWNNSLYGWAVEDYLQDIS